MDIELGAFALLIRAADDYRKNGVLPDYITSPKKKAARKATPGADKEALKAEIIGSLRDLNSNLKTLDHTAIEEKIRSEMKRKGTTKDLILQIAEEFNAPAKTSMSKPALVDCIVQHFSSRKASIDRVSMID